MLMSDRRQRVFSLSQGGHTLNGATCVLLQVCKDLIQRSMANNWDQAYEEVCCCASELQQSRWEAQHGNQKLSLGSSAHTEEDAVPADGQLLCGRVGGQLPEGACAADGREERAGGRHVHRHLHAGHGRGAARRRQGAACPLTSTSAVHMPACYCRRAVRLYLLAVGASSRRLRPTNACRRVCIIGQERADHCEQSELHAWHGMPLLLRCR